MDIASVGLLLALGAAVGFAAGLLGIGGGMLLVPFMTMLLGARGFPADQVVKVAIATSLTTILFTSLSSVRAHHARGAVRWELVRRLSPGILAGSLAGSKIASYLPGRVLAGTFALFVGFSAVRMLRDAGAPAGGRPLPGRAGMLGAGATIGVLSALVGAGGAFVSVPFMAGRDVRMHDAVATSAALGFPIALAGTVGYVVAGWDAPLPPGTLGFVYLPALASIATASILTAPLGARVAHALPTAKLKRVFAALLLVLGAYMIGRALA